jgi:hypothetical protein
LPNKQKQLTPGWLVLQGHGETGFRRLVVFFIARREKEKENRMLHDDGAEKKVLVCELTLIWWICLCQAQQSFFLELVLAPLAL